MLISCNRHYKEELDIARSRINLTRSKQDRGLETLAQLWKNDRWCEGKQLL